MTEEELTEIAEYILSVMTEEEKNDYLSKTCRERRTMIVNYLENRG